MVQIESGSFTSDGLARNISPFGAGINDKMLVIVKGGAQKGAFWTTDMPAGSLKAATGAVILQAADGIRQHADGITIDADNAGAVTRINISGTLYHWTIIRDNGDGDFTVFSYTGNATAESKTDADFTGTPNVAFVFPASVATGRAIYWAASTMVAGQSKQLASTSESSRITGLVSGGISVGTGAQVNASGETYYVALLKDVAGLVKLLTYTSQATGHSITGAGFDPEIFLVNVENSSSEMAFRGKDQTGDAAYGMGATNTATARITAEITDGFSVGTAALTNDTVTPRPYHALVLKDGGAEPPPDTGLLPSSMMLLGVGR